MLKCGREDFGIRKNTVTPAHSMHVFIASSAGGKVDGYSNLGKNLKVE
jgi:hypothetical protein